LRITDRIRQDRKRAFLCGSLLSVALIALFFWRITSGDVDLSLSDVVGALLGWGSNDQAHVIVRVVRLPRIMASMGAGASLAVSGVVLQALLANPLAEPYTLGIASGAAFGASLAILSGWVVTISAFAGALVALALVMAISWRSGGSTGHTVLAGIVVGSSLSAGVTLAKALAGDKVAGIVFWLMGGFAGASWGSVFWVWFGVLIVSSSLFFSSDLDALSLGGNNGAVLGVDERVLRPLLAVAAAFSAASVVSFFGVIGFVGLVVPHLVRISIGASHRVLLPLSMLTGALLLSGADGIVRELGELPVGVLTSLVGGPFFCWILIRERGRG
jgi:iron complex transport system permease protein